MNGKNARVLPANKTSVSGSSSVPSSTKKIKKFRISPRPSYILKNLRYIAPGVAQNGEIDETIAAEVRQMQSLVSTSALYETIGKSHFPDWLNDYHKQESSLKSVAASLFAVSIGAKIQQEINECQTKDDEFRGAVLTAIAKELTDQAASFVLRLISDELKNEGAAVLETRYPKEPEIIQHILSALGAGKIGITFADGMVSPIFSRIAVVLWVRPSKKKPGVAAPAKPS